ncbi:MAG: hypothetical protein R6U32_05140 [Candidatus Woesearchaeota archaeon]
MDDTNLAERVKKHGFAAVVEVAAGMPRRDNFYRDLSDRKDQCMRGKRNIERITGHKYEVAAGFAFYSRNARGEHNDDKISPGELDFVMRLRIYDRKMLWDAYDRMMDESPIGRKERTLANMLYVSRRSINLVALQEKSGKEKEDAMEMMRLPKDYFEGPLDTIRGLAAESYVRLLFEEKIGKCDITSRLHFTKDDSSLEEGFKIYDTDLVISCGKDDFYNAIQNISESRKARVVR